MVKATILALIAILVLILICSVLALCRRIACGTLLLLLVFFHVLLVIRNVPKLKIEFEVLSLSPILVSRLFLPKCSSPMRRIAADVSSSDWPCSRSAKCGGIGGPALVTETTPDIFLRTCS